MNHIYRALTFILCFMVFNSWANTPTFEEALFTTCANRTASNTTLCMNGDFLNTQYGGYILFEGLDNHYTFQNGRLQEFLDRTARLTRRWVNIGRSDVKFDIDVTLSGRTTVAPNEPKEHYCFDADPFGFYYYTHTSGTITGRDKAAGAKLEVSRFGPAFQVGIGANVTNADLNLGASGWLAINMISNTNTDLNLVLQASRAGGNRDININLDGSPTACFESNISLDCPTDLTTVAQFGANGKAVNWNAPTATTTCTVGSGTTCSSSSLNGFEYLGEFNGSRYYCSAENNHTWLEARDLAIAAGGHLAVVCSAAENEFLRSGLLNHEAWIGFSDYTDEGNFKWADGSDCSYTNWREGEPNNFGGDEDFTRILKETGQWTDRNAHYETEFIMEIPCEGGMEPGEVVTTQIAGPAPGSVFPIGMTTVTYESVDECGNTKRCSFKVTVEEGADPCSGNGSPIVEVDVTDPECGQDNGKIKFTFGDNAGRTGIEFSRDGGQTFDLSSPDNAGMAMYGDLAPGTYSVAVRWGNDDCLVDLGTVSLEDVRQAVGTECNDGNSSTINDVIAADGCTCAGTPVGAISIVCEDDITVVAGPDDDGVIVIFDEPTTSTTCGLNGLAIEQVEGPASGSLFPFGSTTVKYVVTDACDNMEMCSFEVVVEETPLTLDIDCVDNIEVTAAVGDNGAIVTFNNPSIDTNCPADEFTVTITEGLESGSLFPVGSTTVTFEVTDGCGQVEECSIIVVVNPAPTGDITFDCNDDITIAAAPGANSAIVTYTVPTAQTTCSLDGLSVVRTAGLASGVSFPVGTTTVTYEATDACGEAATCTFDVTVTPTDLPKGSIGDLVFLDEDQDGIQDADEIGVGNVTVKLQDAQGNTLRTTLTENDGSYLFEDVDAGDYKIMVNAPTGLELSPANAGNNDNVDSDILPNSMTEVFTLGAGEDIDDIDAGLFLPVVEEKVKVGDIVFFDENGNGIQDSEETGIQNIFISLYDGNGQFLAFTTSDENGMYMFSDLDPGDYQLKFVGQASDLTATTQDAGNNDDIDSDIDLEGFTEVFTLVAGYDDSRDAGFKPRDIQPDPARIGNQVFLDANENGINDGEAGIDGVEVKLLATDGTVLQTTTTANNGMYNFSVDAGTYMVMFGTPTGFNPTAQSGNAADGVDNDSDSNPATGMTGMITVAAGDANPTIDAGFVEDDVVIGGPVDCAEVTASVEEGKVIVQGLNGSDAKVEVIGAGTSWAPVLICGDGGDACGTMAMISDLPEGSYTVKIQLWGTDGSYCYTERNVTVDGGTPTCTVEGGTISTNDDITDLCVNDGEASIVNFTVAGSNGPNSAWVVTKEDGTILNPDAPSSVDFEGAGTGTCKVYYVRYENVDGLVAGANINDLTGCFDKSNSISVTRTEDCDGTGEPICDDVTVTTGNGKINLVGLSAPFAVVKIHDINAGWSIVDQCFGCEDPTTFTVPEGDYNVVIEFYRGVWNDKYCRRDVAVSVGEDVTPIDNDRDGIPADEDCDDTDDSIGAKQNPGTSCDDGNDATMNDVILADGCGCAGVVIEDKEICAERDIFNTDNCQFNIIYGLYLKLDGYDEYYTVSDGSFVEYTDGTALFTATATNNTTPNIGWEIEVMYGGRTTLAEVAPKQHNCLTANVNDFYFYETLEGKLTGINDAAGASMNVMRIGPAFQLGVAANITHNAYDFGGSGWFVADMLTQPTNGLEFILNEGAQGQHGDFNINLSGDGTECIEGRDNSELDCANVSVIATADGITINGLTAPIEIVKVFNASWAPIGDCTGDCGESMTVDATPGNYMVRVNFYTANWQGECEVDIPVTVPASANSASSRNAPQLNMNTFENNRAVTVEWLTNTGYMNDSYVIEKSTDGNIFEAMDEVSNKDNSDDLAYYKGVDAQPVLGANYYRVKQIYVDGSFDYSDVQLVNFNLDLQTLSVFPNPAREELFVSLKAHAGQTANLQIINNFGQVVRQLEIDEIPTEAIRLDLGDVQNGMYHLSIRVDKSNIITKKVLVNRLY